MLVGFNYHFTPTKVLIIVKLLSTSQVIENILKEVKIMKTHLRGKNHKLLLTSVKEEREDVFRDNAVLSRS